MNRVLAGDNFVNTRSQSNTVLEAESDLLP